MKRAVLYARVSTSNHGQTTENQLVALREVCHHQSWTILQELSDEVCRATRDAKTALDSAPCTRALLVAPMMSCWRGVLIGSVVR
ncbi:MAG: recombinase family protein [Nitrospira sp.]|nr:recombinase family protein [Nitrospira sp.]